MDPVATVYGVAPKTLGTTTDATMIKIAANNTNQATTSNSQRSTNQRDVTSRGVAGAIAVVTLTSFGAGFSGAS
jgi:hypothetical protein